MCHSDGLYHNSMLARFQREFGVARLGIKLHTQLTRTRRWQEGRILQHSRWEKMGHKFVFTGLDTMIVMEKGEDK